MNTRNATKEGQTGVRNFFRLAVQRGAARGEMQGGYVFRSGTVGTGYTKEITAIVATASGAEVAEIRHLTASQRSIVGKHWDLVQKVKQAKNSKERLKAERQLKAFVRSRKLTGGPELASDLAAIERDRLVYVP